MKTRHQTEVGKSKKVAVFLAEQQFSDSQL
jgi:hypothetical protein